MRKIQCFTWNYFKATSESESRKVEFLNVLCKVCEFFETFRVLEYKIGSTKKAVNIQLAFVGDICRFVFGKCLNIKQGKYEN